MGSQPALRRGRNSRPGVVADHCCYAIVNGQRGLAARAHHALAACTIAALLCLRDHVIAPILAGVRSPRQGRKPGHWTAVGRHYETLRIGMQTLFGHLGIARAA